MTYLIGAALVFLGWILAMVGAATGYGGDGSLASSDLSLVMFGVVCTLLVVGVVVCVVGAIQELRR